MAPSSRNPNPSPSRPLPPTRSTPPLPPPRSRSDRGRSATPPGIPAGATPSPTVVGAASPSQSLVLDHSPQAQRRVAVTVAWRNTSPKLPRRTPSPACFLYARRPRPPPRAPLPLTLRTPVRPRASPSPTFSLALVLTVALAPAGRTVGRARARPWSRPRPCSPHPDLLSLLRRVRAALRDHRLHPPGSSRLLQAGPRCYFASEARLRSPSVAPWSASLATWSLPRWRSAPSPAPRGRALRAVAAVARRPASPMRRRPVPPPMAVVHTGQTPPCPGGLASPRLPDRARPWSGAPISALLAPAPAKAIGH